MWRGNEAIDGTRLRYLGSRKPDRARSGRTFWRGLLGRVGTDSGGRATGNACGLDPKRKGEWSTILKINFACV